MEGKEGKNYLLSLETTPALAATLPSLTLCKLDLTFHGLSSGQRLWFDVALVNKLVPPLGFRVAL